MNTYPTLTISLLDRLTDRELQSNYLNYLNRTAEIATLLTQITEPDLALRIVNLALEVDLYLGAKLTASIEPALQKIIVDRIDALAIPTRLKIELWYNTKSKAALPYLQNIFSFDDPHIHELGIVAEPPNVEHLLYLLYDPEISDELCKDAIEALELIGGEKVFEWLHQAMYWVSNTDEFISPFDKIVEVLFKLDRDRTLTSLEGAIQSYDPEVRRRAAIAIGDWQIPLVDRSLTILLNAIDDFDLDVQLVIVRCVREKIARIFNKYNSVDVNITPELIDRAILLTKPILIKCANHPNLEIRDTVIDLLLGSEPDERESIVKLAGNVSPDRASRLERIPIESGDLPSLLAYLKHDFVEVRASAAASIGAIEDDSIVPILLELIHDSEQAICEAAVKSIVRLGSEPIFPTILELASNSALVATLISALRKLADDNLHAAIFSNFHRNRDATLKFIEIAEQTNVENIRNKTHRVNGDVFALQAIGDDLAVTALQEILEAEDSYDDIDQAVLSLANIGTERAMLVLLSFLPDLDKFYGWIAMQFHRLGKLGLIPQLWSAAYQVHSFRSSELITRIQEREGLYNPDFSDRSHPLFEPPRPRLRHILLGDN